MKIIAYGSLLYKPSLERSLGRNATLMPLILPGYKRVFNAPFDGYSYTNIVPLPTTAIEAAYFQISRSELARFALREAGSDLMEVLPSYYAFIWPTSLCLELSVPQSYLDVCLSGAEQLGLDFWVGTTRPSVVEADRQSPVYLP
jgi:hypothetical protein